MLRADRAASLLQAREYAKALIEADNVDATPEQVDRFVEARMPASSG